MSFFFIMFMLVFFLVFGMVLFTFVRNIGQWHENNNLPRLTVQATVVSKRGDVSRHHNAGTHTSHTSTTYYVTFQVASGDRMELCVSGGEYGMLVEGDYGDLTFQGTRYLGFERR